MNICYLMKKKKNCFAIENDRTKKRYDNLELKNLINPATSFQLYTHFINLQQPIVASPIYHTDPYFVLFPSLSLSLSYSRGIKSCTYVLPRDKRKDNFWDWINDLGRNGDDGPFLRSAAIPYLWKLDTKYISFPHGPFLHHCRKRSS